MEQIKKHIRKLIRESVNSLFEAADDFTVDGKRFSHSDEDAIPFLYLKNKLYIGCNGCSHTDIVYSNEISAYFKSLEQFYLEDEGKKSKSDEGTKDDAIIFAREFILDEAKDEGRIWTEGKIISFWEHMESIDRLMFIIEELNKNIKNLNIDNSWKIYTWRSGLVPIFEYVPSKEKMSTEEKLKQMEK